MFDPFVRDYGKDHQFLTRQQVCEWLQIHPDTLDRWRKTKGFPCIRIERAVRFDKAKVVEWLENQEKAAALREAAAKKKGGAKRD